MNGSKRGFIIRKAAMAMVVVLLMVPALLRAQTPAPVVISSEKIVSEGKVYYMHLVQKGQTLYSIARAYTVPVDLLARENGITDNSIREGQMLRIPAAVVAQGQAAQKSATADPQKQAGGQPGTGRPEASVTERPAQSYSYPGTQDERYIYHRVARGETLGSVANEYGISVRELKRANRGLLFPHEGDWLLIPRNKISLRKAGQNAIQPAEVFPADTVTADTLAAEEEMEEFTVPGERTKIDRLHGSVRVAVLFPFFIRENNARTYADTTARDELGNRIYLEGSRSSRSIYDGSLPFLEAYEGILIAVDSLRSLGLTVELDVFDTGADTLTLHRLLLSGSLDGTELIIGPVFSYHLEQIADWAAERDIPVVSPVPLRDSNITENKPTLYRVFPSESVIQEIMAGELLSHPDSKVIFLHSDSAMYNPATYALWQKISDTTGGIKAAGEGRLAAHHYTGATANRNVYGNVATLESLLDPERDNIIVLATTQTPVVSSLFSSLHSLTRRYRIKVLGYPEIRGLETIDLKYYYDLELCIPAESFIDFGTPATQAFSSSFMKKFRTEPMAESFAWRGFDIAWYFIGGLSTGGKEFLRDPGIFNPDLLCLEPDFRRYSRQNGYENRGIFILQYRKDMSIEMKRPWSEPIPGEENFQNPFRIPFSDSTVHSQGR